MLHRMLLCKRPRRRNKQVPAVEIAARQSTVGIKRAASTDITSAMEFIRANACEPIRIEAVAASVHVPLRTFELEFAAVMGTTVGEEIRRVKLERVKHLLVTTELPLSTVARLVGINDASYLSNFFRRLTGHTPAQYRKQHRFLNDSPATEATATRKVLVRS
jgi:LacI family transcriptional regulator